MLHSKYSTKKGFFALFIWSFSPLLASQLKSIPTFEMLSMIFAVSGLTILLKVCYYSEWYKLKQHFLLYIIGIIGIYGNDLFYFEAFKHSPPTHVELINYLWPIFVIIFSTMLPNKKIEWQQILGSSLSFLGIYVLICSGTYTNFSYSYLKGYGLALADALVWAFYVITVRHYKHKGQYSEVIGLYCLICAFFSLYGHLYSEVFVSPSFLEVITMCLLGIFSQGLAYILWEQSVKGGDYQLLSNMAYFTPVSSVCILIVFNKASLTVSLLISTLLISAGAFVANRSKLALIFKNKEHQLMG